MLSLHITEAVTLGMEPSHRALSEENLRVKMFSGVTGQQSCLYHVCCPHLIPEHSPGGHSLRAGHGGPRSAHTLFVGECESGICSSQKSQRAGGQGLEQLWFSSHVPVTSAGWLPSLSLETQGPREMVLYLT